MTKLTENQELRLNILRETAKAIITSVEIIELCQSQEKVMQMIGSMEVLNKDANNCIERLKADLIPNSQLSPLLQNILNSYA